MNKIFNEIGGTINKKWLMKNIARLTEIELGQTFKNYHSAAKFTVGLIKEAGIENAEIINFPADGKTVYQDKRMPLAWNVTKGRLTIKKSTVKFENPVIADYERHPFHLVKGSVSTSKDGVNVRIITETQLFSGEDAKGCLVILNPFTRPLAKILSAALDLGAIGLVSDFLRDRYDTPDGIQWVTACTEGNHWHVQSDDRPFICFSVSPRVGDLLRQSASEGEVMALVECDGIRSEGELPLVTALIPGKQDKELWILSHLYEPLSDDNSSGVIASIEIARVLKELSKSGVIPRFEFSLRLVFGMEMYGIAAFADKIGTSGRAKVIGAINTDSMQVSQGAKTNVFMAAPGTGFFGNNLMEYAIEKCRTNLEIAINCIVEEGMYADDTFLSEPTNGIPTLWFLGNGKWWHNSEQKMDIIDSTTFLSSIAVVGMWTAAVLTVNSETLPAVLPVSGTYAIKHLQEEAQRILDAYASGELRITASLNAEIHERIEYRLKRDIESLADFCEVLDSPLIDAEIERLKIEARQIITAIEMQIKNIRVTGKNINNDKWFEYSVSIIPKRSTIGFPNDLAAVPKEERIPLPDGMIYGPFARIYANMDGKKTLQRLVREAEWETNTVISSSQIKKYITAIAYLTDYGYIKTTFNKQYNRNDIVHALKNVGVKEGDLLMVHSSLSSFGVVKGGSDTVINAMLECVGENGTLLFPAFTRPFTYFEGEVVKGAGYRPYDAAMTDLVWVGSVPKAFLQRTGVVRSKHATHSVAGFGPLAEKCLLEHRESDAPMCKRSPFGKMLEFNGKILHFGSDLGSTTFLHFLEDEVNSLYLGNAICRIKDGEKIRTTLIPKHLPGHRDFYIKNAEKCKFFKKVVADGLEIKKTIMGLGNIQLMDVEKLYEHGIKAIKEDPNIFLCDDPQCLFCSKYNKKRKS